MTRCCDTPEGAPCAHDTIPTVPMPGWEHREQLLQAAAELHTAITKFTESFMPMARALADSYAQFVRQLREAGYLDDQDQPVKPADRPAWQSPYGPPKRRR
ncbi:hypothetical protein F9278_36285 [Streptomyces phaeolivaceus]|uniref:Uncharacterized protein n=1 Tax=Streptomyces phaeolivaceus TaxID=2653200 RepID=A0A5P8KBU5_9ACTN|nr:hypothetical protein [Streptomyces phaeolivaceus]QFR00736.1 hypothetical protein F9278_36285 [Streptomyces phaeolivaceus]